MDQAELGERMAALRPSWSRSTVVKLENLNREQVSVADWLALAAVLNVPPPMLLTDPRTTDPVPLPTGDVSAWGALLWLVGSSASGGGSDVGAYHDSADVVDAIRAVHDAIMELGRTTTRASGRSAQEARERNDERHRAALERLARELIRLDGAGVRRPAMDEQVVELIYRRADELGVQWFPELQPTADGEAYYRRSPSASDEG